MPSYAPPWWFEWVFLFAHLSVVLAGIYIVFGTIALFRRNGSPWKAKKRNGPA